MKELWRTKAVLGLESSIAWFLSVNFCTIKVNAKVSDPNALKERLKRILEFCIKNKKTSQIGRVDTFVSDGIYRCGQFTHINVYKSFKSLQYYYNIKHV